MAKSYNGTYYYVHDDTARLFYMKVAYEMYCIYDTIQDIQKGSGKKYHLTVPKQTPYSNATRPHLTNESTRAHIYIEKGTYAYIFRDVKGQIVTPTGTEKSILDDVVGIKGIMAACGY